MIVKMSEVVAEVNPDLVLVHGDTTTAMATGLAAFYSRKRLGHVEAGLRSHDLSRPWPEEFNRVAIDAIAEFLFAPTDGARVNLENEGRGRGEGRTQSQIFVTGNTGIDALLYLSRQIDADGDLARGLERRYGFLQPGRPLVLVTGHRRESFGDGMNRICDGLARVADTLDIDLVYPVHLNPRVRETVNARLGGRPRIHLLDPVDYADMVYLMKRASVIVTDSGGIQEEAPALGRPVLVTREVTERPEAVASGHVELVGSDPDLLFDRVVTLLDGAAPPIAPAFPYGDGTAALRITDILERELCP
jgi:UDP-N-acetylglucosamine 2-epimerase